MPSFETADSDALLAAIVGLSSDAMIATDAATRVRFLNPVAEALTGYTREDAVGRPLAEVFQAVDEDHRQPMDVAAILDLMRASSAPIRLLLMERAGTERADTERAVDARATQIVDRHGNPSNVVWLFRDVTANREAGQAAARLAAIVTSSDDAIIGKDLRGTVTSWNAGAERLFGFTAAEMIGQSITRIIPADRMAEEDEILGRLRRGIRIDHFSTIRARKDGTPVRVSITVSPIRDDRGRIVGASKVARDITVLHDANQALGAHARDLESMVRERTRVLEETVAELEGLSYSLSHDMRTPVRAIASFSEIVLMEHGERLGTDGADNLRRVIGAAARLDHLIRDVLAFTRVARGDAVVSRVDTDALVRSLVDETPDLLEPQASVRVDPLPAVMGHETLLGQCMTNLLTNAVKFVRSGQKAEVRVYAEEDRENRRVRLCVRDNGIGIDATLQPRLFTMFERLPTMETYAGTGLGLAIARKAAERMGGSVGVRSEAGRGSTFWVELPRAG